jgi:hypothetical protein
MRITSKKTVYEGRFLRIVEKSITGENGAKGVWESVERIPIPKGARRNYHWPSQMRAT